MGLKLASLAMTARLPKSVVDLIIGAVYKVEQPRFIFFYIVRVL